MNMYGFRKVDDCFYENDNFKRNCEHLLKNMIRKHPNKHHHAFNQSPNHHIQHPEDSHHQQLTQSSSKTHQQLAMSTLNHSSDGKPQKSLIRKHPYRVPSSSTANNTLTSPLSPSSAIQTSLSLINSNQGSPATSIGNFTNSSTSNFASSATYDNSATAAAAAVALNFASGTQPQYSMQQQALALQQLLFQHQQQSQHTSPQQQQQQPQLTNELYLLYSFHMLKLLLDSGRTWIDRFIMILSSPSLFLWTITSLNLINICPAY